MKIEIKVGENQLTTSDVEFALMFVKSLKPKNSKVTELPSAKVYRKKRKVGSSKPWNEYDINIIKTTMELTPSKVKPLLTSTRSTASVYAMKAKIKNGIIQ
jgi:hypothetical protein